MGSEIVIERREDIERLKANWKNDPCWDIEETTGFEDVKTELLAFRLECEMKWRERANEQLKEKAEVIGLTGNPKLLAYVLMLETRIHGLEQRLSDLSGAVENVYFRK